MSVKGFMTRAPGFEHARIIFEASSTKRHLAYLYIFDILATCAKLVKTDPSKVVIGSKVFSTKNDKLFSFFFRFKNRFSKRMRYSLINPIINQV